MVALIWEIVRHPLRALGLLMFMAALEGMFGSPSGAQKVAALVVYSLAFALVGLVVAAGVLLTMAGYALHLWLALGACVVVGFIVRHLRWT